MSEPAFTLEHAAARAAERRREIICAAAMRRHRSRWWSSRCPYAVLRGQLREPVLLVPLPRLVEAAELVLGREVDVAEFANPAALRAELDELFPR